MLLFKGRITFTLYFCLTILQWSKRVVSGRDTLATESNTSGVLSNCRPLLVEQLLKLLHKLEVSNDLNKDTKFAALLSEFLIKQTNRFQEPTRYKDQLYYHVAQQLDKIIRRTEQADLTVNVKNILDNVFQMHSLMLIEPTLKFGFIDTHLSYQFELASYDNLLATGYPNATTSDECLAALVMMTNCNVIRSDCLSLITSDVPNFGYQRMHQILLLYVFMHHKCAAHFGSRTAYSIVARQHCTQVHREQQIIRRHDVPIKYRDLFVEQNVLCGLFGYAEFMNWHNLHLMRDWQNIDGCYCQLENVGHRLNCDCTNHINSLVLVYYINALLLLA